MAGAARLGRGIRGVDTTEALAAAAAAAWRWEVGSPVVGWSPGASLALAVPDIVLGSPELLRAAIEPTDLALLRAAMQGWRYGEPIRAQVRVRIDGTVRWFDVAGRVVVSGDATPHYATGIARDVTEAREAQDSLLASLRELERALEHLDALESGGAAGAARRRVA